MLKLFLWLRYLRKRKIVLLSIAAVALSVSLLIVVSSLFTGFIHTFEDAAVLAMGDVVIDPPIKIGKYRQLCERLEQIADVQTATATLSGQGLLYLGKGNVRAVSVLGINPVKHAQVTGFKASLCKQGKLRDGPSFELAGASGETGGFVGVGVIARPDEKTDAYDFAQIEKMIGRQVILTTGSSSIRKDGSGVKVRRKTVRFTVADVAYTGVYYLDRNFVYLPIEQLQAKLYPDEAYPVADQIRIRLAAGARPDRALAAIRGVWELFAGDELGWSASLIRYTDIMTSREKQSRYIAEFMKQMGILMLVFGVVSFGVVVLVFCILYMIVRLKQKDIAIIKSCGTSSGSVAILFVGFGGCIGIVGAGFGTLLGYIITKNINTLEGWVRIIFGLKLWKSSVYMFNRIPNEINWNWVLVIVASAVVSVSLGALIPAIMAAWTRPVNILRYE